MIRENATKLLVFVKATLTFLSSFNKEIRANPTMHTKHKQYKSKFNIDENAHKDKVKTHNIANKFLINFDAIFSL